MVHSKHTTFFRKIQVTVKDLQHFSGRLVYSYLKTITCSTSFFLQQDLFKI